MAEASLSLLVVNRLEYLDDTVGSVYQGYNQTQSRSRE